ncbi:NK-tumor recognition protein isoform X2 [Ambystoma mexicanum]|uniref:NK-tumor recognition protein isoform X2 n=1 Tax=Ambystoma mexicanum TaxID=8296 RepID=UPI0037E87BA2
MAAASAMGVKVRPQCFFDMEINREPVGRITFQLFSDVCQKTCKNFLYLCTGEKGIGKSTGKKLCYKGSTFHRVVKNFMIQGGDFSEGNGKGGESIYGGYFKDENFILKHDRAFLLSMANRGKHTNGSQFFITTRPAPHLDNVHVVFGLVISGFEVIERIENLKTDAASRPYADVRVIDCGLLQTQQKNDERIATAQSVLEASVSKNIGNISPVLDVSIIEKITNVPSIFETAVSKILTKIPPVAETSCSKKITKISPVSDASCSKKITKAAPVIEASVSEKISKVTHGAETALVKEKTANITSDSEAIVSSSKSVSSSDTSFSESEHEVERTRKRKRKRKIKSKPVQKRRKEEKRRKEVPWKEEKRKEELKTKQTTNQRSNHSDKKEPSKDLNLKREKLVVRPEEIPPVPENKFLLRRDVPVPPSEPEPNSNTLTPVDGDQKPSVSKSGRKIKGRGTMRYHTPPRSRSCSESEDDEKSSETPPHWKEEMQRLRAYKPTSGEKWTKGDKLNDTKQMDNRSLSQRSRSWSHDGYYSDLSKERNCTSENHKKDRTTKYKKKSKKQKQSRKSKHLKQEKPPHPKVKLAHSLLRKTKSSHSKEKRSSSTSSSLSSRCSSKRGLSKSDQEQSFSSLSTRKSRSYSKSRSRSYSREHSISRTASKSSSRSQSKLKSRSPSRSSTRSSSKSRHHRSSSRSPKINSTHSTERKTKKDLRPIIQQNDKPVLPPVPQENISLISLSDSPPPSRWKPGLKPWKPSYERIQEIKSKSSNATPLQNSSAASQKKLSSIRPYNKCQQRSDSDQSEKSSDYRPKSKSRSSKSRSYTRSYTRSRSPTSSRSRSRSSATSRSQNKYLSVNSSSSSSDSDSNVRTKGRRKTVVRKKNVAAKESSSESVLNGQSTVDYNEAGDQIRNVRKIVATLNSAEGSNSQNLQTTTHEKLANSSPFKQIKNTKNDQVQHLALLNSNSGEVSTLGSDHEPDLSQMPMKVEEKPSEKNTDDASLKRPADSGSKLESTTFSDKESKPLPDDAIPSSGKEEGEASSDSEIEKNNLKSDFKTRSKSTEIQPPKTSDSKNMQGSLDEIPCLVSENHREKSKKHKHRSAKKNLKKARLKKAKEKAKFKKDRKEKFEKRKPAFLWQPPLEFGEEEEEEVVIEKPFARVIKKDKHHPSANSKAEGLGKNVRKSTSDQSAGPCIPGKETINPTSSSNTVALTESAETNSFVLSKGSQMVNQEDSQTDDNMDLCTPDHTSPENNMDLPFVVGTTSGATIADGDCLLLTEPPKTSFSNHTKCENDVVNVKANETDGKSHIFSLLTCGNNQSQPEKQSVAHNLPVDNKWKPIQGPSSMKGGPALGNSVVNAQAEPESKPQGVRIEIKSKNRVRPGSLFDEVRKTARLNRRPRNQESSSEESSFSSVDKSPSKSPSRSHSKSNSRSYSHSRSRSRTSSYTSRSRSYSRSRSRRRYSRKRRRGHSSSSDRYRSRRTYSRSRSRSRSYSHRRSRSRSYTYDSYSRSRSRSKRRYSRSHSYDRRSRSRRSYRSSRSDCSYSFSESSTDG